MIASYVIVGSCAGEASHFYYETDELAKAAQIFDGRESSYDWLILLDVENGIVVKRKLP